MWREAELAGRSPTPKKISALGQPTGQQAQFAFHPWGFLQLPTFLYHLFKEAWRLHIANNVFKAAWCLSPMKWCPCSRLRPACACLLQPTRDLGFARGRETARNHGYCIPRPLGRDWQPAAKKGGNID